MSTHANAPLSVEGRRRVVQRCRHRPIAHVAAEMGISWATASTSVYRYRRHGEAGLHDRTNRPRGCPAQVPDEVIQLIARLRRERTWPARVIWIEVVDAGVDMCVATVGRWLRGLGLNRRRRLDVDATPVRTPGTITACYRGHMIHLDINKVGSLTAPAGELTASARLEPDTRSATPTCTALSTGSLGWSIPRFCLMRPPRLCLNSGATWKRSSPLMASPPSAG